MSSLPLSGLRVLEFTHAVMGPTAGWLLADLGAEVIHIEPPEGDATRQRIRGLYQLIRGLYQLIRGL